MKYCNPLLTALLLASGGSRTALQGAEPASAANKLNILFIAIDDLRPELGCYGAAQVKSPHIDKLAGQGLRFDRAYCQVPICMGSRASLMTGILPTAKRFVGDCRADVDAPDAATLPETFKKAGYTALSVGKIFHGIEDTAERSWSKPPWQHESHMTSFDPETTRRLSKTKQRGRIYESPAVEDDAYPDGKTAKKAIEDLQRLKESGKPFFLACGFVRPHMPFYAPKKYWDLYDREKIEIADNLSRPKNAPAQLKGSGEFNSYHLADLKPNSPEFHRMMRHGYFACTSYVDKLVGDVLAELERLGLAENTIVVLWGDHGWHLGEHEFWGKHNTLHLSLRVPLIIRVPGKKPGATHALVESSDIFPTLCALASLETPCSVQGRSFLTLLDQPQAPFRDAIYSRFMQGDAIVTEQFNYTSYSNGSAEMLYDLKKDPHENTNIAGTPEARETVQTMRRLLEQRQQEAARAAAVSPPVKTRNKQ
jgi:arylsulfatase A-like enzyme